MDLAKEPIPLGDISKSWVQSDMKLLSQLYAHLGSCCCILGDSGAIARNESRESTLYGFLHVKCLIWLPRRLWVSYELLCTGSSTIEYGYGQCICAAGRR